MLQIIFVSSIVTVHVRTISKGFKKSCDQKNTLCVCVWSGVPYFSKVFDYGTFVDSISIISLVVLVVFGKC